MANMTTSALAPGASQVFTLTNPWGTYSAVYACSDATDASAGLSLYGSADSGATWVLLPVLSSVPNVGGVGANFYSRMAVNALKVVAHCVKGNTVTASVTGL